MANSGERRSTVEVKNEKRPLLEVCVDDVAGLAAAIEGGADRIELCSALAVGGLTPSHGLMTLAAKADVPVYALIRPRAGDFAFTPPEVDIMARDIAFARDAGLAGLVIGASRSDGRLDEAILRDLIQAAGNLDLTLHRAFDLVPDPIEALETAIALGFRRILSSGGEVTATEGIERLRAMAAAAGSRLSVMPGGGVTAETARTFLAIPGVFELHASCGRPLELVDARLFELGFVDLNARQTDANTVRALKQAMLDANA